MRKLLVCLILGRHSQYFNIIEIKGKPYRVDISPYESANELLKRATNNGMFMAQKSKE